MMFYAAHGYLFITGFSCGGNGFLPTAVLLPSSFFFWAIFFFVIFCLILIESVVLVSFFLI